MLSSSPSSPCGVWRGRRGWAAATLVLLGLIGLASRERASAAPEQLKLSLGKPFVQGIISVFEMKVDQITLVKPPSQWAHFAVDLIAFDLVMDIHMDLLFFGAQATLGSAEIILSFGGEPFGVLNTQPCPLGGGGKIKTKMAGTLVVDDKNVFRKVALAVIEEEEFNVELYSVLAVELRGGDNGCMLRKEMCATVGSMRIPNVEFAKSIKLQGAQGFSVKMDKMVVTDLPANVPAGKALIKLSAQVYNPSSFVLDGLDVMSLDVYTDDSWPFTEKPAADSLGVKFVEAFTEPGFWLGRGHSEWFDIEGFLSVPEREYDLVKMADVLNHFLTSRPTPLIAYVAGSTQPFIDTASKGAALRAFLPGLPPGDHNIVQHVYINLDIPTAIATLLNPLNSARLHQYCQVELKNPLDATLYVLGLTAEILYKNVHVGMVELPILEPDQRYTGGATASVPGTPLAPGKGRPYSLFLVSWPTCWPAALRIILPPMATFRTKAWYPVELFGKDLAYILLLLKDINPIGCEESDTGCGVATVDLNARIKVRVGGTEPILVYKQWNVTVSL